MDHGVAIRRRELSNAEWEFVRPLLQLGRSAVYDLLRTRQLASFTLGRARRIPAHALADFIRTRLDQEAA